MMPLALALVGVTLFVSVLSHGGEEGGRERRRNFIVYICMSGICFILRGCVYVCMSVSLSMRPCVCRCHVCLSPV